MKRWILFQYGIPHVSPATKLAKGIFLDFSLNLLWANSLSCTRRRFTSLLQISGQATFCYTANTIANSSSCPFPLKTVEKAERIVRTWEREIIVVKIVSQLLHMVKPIYRNLLGLIARAVWSYLPWNSEAGWSVPYPAWSWCWLQCKPVQGDVILLTMNHTSATPVGTSNP